MTANSYSELQWADIDYTKPIPDFYLVPPHHWPELEENSLKEMHKIKLNHLLTYFTCEMFIHFERSIIQYMEFNQEKLLEHVSQSQIEKFIEEEKIHIHAFEKLAELIRPDLYKNNKPRFLFPSAVDRWIAKHPPVSVFFMMAFLFEEMTLFFSEVMEENLEQSFLPVLQVMQLHRRDEKSHVGIDRKILNSIQKKASSWKIRWEMITLLPLIAISDIQVSRAWKEAIAFFAKENQLSSQEIRELQKKGISKSDKLGMQSFISKLKSKPIPGTSLLKFVLQLLSK